MRKTINESERLSKMTIDLIYESIIILKKLESLKKDGYTDVPEGFDLRGLKESNLDKAIREYKSGLVLAFSNLQDYSPEDNLYYFDCPFKVYLETFEDRLGDYFNQVIDGTEEDFLLSELDYFVNPHKNRILYYNYGKPFYYHEFFWFEECYKVSLRRKLEFLGGLLLEYGIRIEIIENTNLYDSSSGDLICHGTDVAITQMNGDDGVERKIRVVNSSLDKSRKNQTKEGEVQNSEYKLGKGSSGATSNLQNFNNKMFRSLEAQEWFHETMCYLGGINEDGTVGKYMQVLADAMLKNEDCKELIFAYTVGPKEMIAFLRSEYKAKIKSNYKLSDGAIHKFAIEKRIKSFKN